MPAISFKNKTLIKIISISIIYLIIVVGQLFGWEQAIELFPIAIALLAAMILITWQIPPKVKIKLVLAALVCLFIYETLQVHTSVLGSVKGFSPELGLKLAGVPIIVIFYELVAIISTWQIVYLGKLLTAKKFAAAALIIVMQNLVIEKFAAEYNLWSWQSLKAPLTNYFVLLMIAIAFFYILHRFVKIKQNDLFIACSLPATVMFFWLMLVVR